MYTEEFLAEQKQYWLKKYAEAKDFMLSREVKENAKVLIEIAAQHPLKDGDKPGKEFQARLDKGIELFNQERRKGNFVEIYVPGSRHMYNGIADKISLASAGKIYLLNHGIDEKLIHADDLNEKYKGNEGVYNSADECFVSSSYFKDGNFNKLISVLSPVQIMRKSLLYIEFGVIPLSYSVPLDETYHNYIVEATFQIPYVLYEDHSWQGKDSVLGQKTRQERIPKDDK